MHEGPRYDNALRELAAEELVDVCRWLGIDADATTMRLAESLPVSTQYVDLLTRDRAGDLAHVEFFREPAPDVAHRMLEYRARIMRRDRPARLRQHVVLLAGGRVDDRIEDGDRFFLRYGVTYVRDHDPHDLLARPGLAALASLGRASGPGERAEILTEAYRVIAEGARPERRTDLAGVAAVLAAIHLDADTIDRAGREAGMPISLDGTVGGRSLEARGEARGEARVVAALLERRFGADERIEALAVRLVAEGADGASGPVDRVLSAAGLEELLGA